MARSYAVGSAARARSWRSASDIVIAVGACFALVSRDKETSPMKLGSRISLLLMTIVFVAGCGPSQADYDRAKRQMQLVTTERDNMKSQLDQATAKIQTLQQQVTTLQAQAAPKPETAENSAPKATAKKKHGHAKGRKHSKKG
jgi:hypothetical protein